ncbi:MAG: hypothetical protein RL594_100 [Bacteroidota bacterium]|jgi:hypothetical protein
MRQRRLGTLIGILLWLFLQIEARSQTEISDYGRLGHAAFLTTTVSDYQCIGINPANLGFSPELDISGISTPIAAGMTFSRRHWSLGIGQVGISARSDALSKPRLLDLLYQRGSATAFTPQDQIQAAQEFADRGVRFNIDILVFGASYQSKRFGGFGVTVRDRFNGAFKLNADASKIIFQGRRADYFDSSYTNWRGDTIGVARQPQLFSQLFDGTRLALSWTREFNVSIGIPLWIAADQRLCVGMTGKYLQPFAYLEANAGGGAFTAYSALSPWFNINYGNAVTPSRIAGTALQPVGLGFGVDLGMTYQSKSISVAVSIIDIGTITYNGNVFSAGDTVVNGLGTTGFDSYNLFEEAPKITGEGKYFVWSGLQSTAAPLPTRMRAGVSYSVDPRLTFGFDCTVPMGSSGINPESMILSTGLSVKPYQWLTLGTGLGTGDGMDIFVPGSILISMGKLWEFGVSTFDLSSLFTDRLPIVSTTVGFVRLRF